MTVLHQLFLQTQRELFDATAEKYEDYAAELVAVLLDHAWRNVPAYRDRLAPIITDQSFDLLDWDHLPVLRPEDFASKTGTFVAATLPPHAQEYEIVMPHPGLPLVLRSTAMRVAIDCEQELACERYDIDLSGTMAIVHPDHAGGGGGKGWSVTFPRNSWVAMAADAPVEQRMAWLAGCGARVLRTTDAQALELANAARGHGIALDTIIIADRMLSPQTRSVVTDAFRCRVLHLVDLPAIGPVAVSDPEGSGYIAAASTMIVEVVGGDGRKLPSGEPGQVVVTPLYEYATPLIRYATGLAAVGDERDASRLGLRHLRALGGDVGL